jgi:hypothetical protein
MAVTLSASALKDLAAERTKPSRELAFADDVAKVTKWRDSVTVADLNTRLSRAAMSGKNTVRLTSLTLNNVNMEDHYAESVAEATGVISYLTIILGEGITPTLVLSDCIRWPAFVIKLSW